MLRSPFKLREQPGRRPAALLVALSVVIGACGGASHASVTTVTRPFTDAKLQILSPSPNEVTGPTVTASFRVIGATISPPSKVIIVPNEGHIHVTVDGQLVEMAYRSTTVLHGLSPGSHTLQAEFVANDHLSFADPVKAVVFFTVKG